MTNLNMPISESTPVSQALNAADAAAWTTACELTRKMIAIQNQALSDGLPLEALHQCIAASSHLLGLEREDNPGQVSRTLQTLELHIGEQAWTSSQLRADCLFHLRLCQLGSQGVLNEEAFAARLVSFALPRVPLGPRAAASLQRNRLRGAALSVVAISCESEQTTEMFTLASRIIRVASIDDDTLAADATTAAYTSVQGAADMLNTNDSGYCLDRIVLGAADAAVFADQAKRLGCCDARQSVEAASNATLDQSLAAYVEAVVQILRDMNAPGCRWLDLLKALR